MMPAAPDVVYISPRGKRCVLVPSNSSRPWFEFRYLDDTSLAGPGFYLRRDLFHRVMREAPWVPPVAAVAGAGRR